MVHLCRLLVAEGGIRRLMFIIDLKGRFSPKVTRLATLVSIGSLLFDYYTKYRLGI